MTKEQWKPVVGYEEYYEISNIGRVRRRQTGRILKPRISNGYFLVDLRVRGKRKYHRVHRLVAYSFIGIQPTLKHEVRHFDGNKQNNNSNNLSWGTREDNEFDKIRHNKTNRGQRNGRSKLTLDQVIEIRKLLLQGDLLQRQIAEMFNVTRMTISDIKGERSWAK
jgi:predicted XRE-type DNA-binding protein